MATNITRSFDSEKVAQLLQMYPRLELIICAGTISLKATREILNIDRYLCYNLYLDLLEAGAIYSAGSSLYRATPEMRAYMQSRINTEENT